MTIPTWSCCSLTQASLLGQCSRPPKPSRSHPRSLRPSVLILRALMLSALRGLLFCPRSSSRSHFNTNGTSCPAPRACVAQSRRAPWQNRSRTPQDPGGLLVMTTHRRTNIHSSLSMPVRRCSPKTKPRAPEFAWTAMQHQWPSSLSRASMISGPEVKRYKPGSQSYCPTRVLC